MSRRKKFADRHPPAYQMVLVGLSPEVRQVVEAMRLTTVRWATPDSWVEDRVKKISDEYEREILGRVT